MSFRATILKRSCFIVFLLSVISSSAALGQATNSPVAFVSQEAITSTFVAVPNLGESDSSGGSGDKAQWMKVEFHYGTTPLLTSKYLDEVEFKVWIEGIDLLAKNAPVPGKGVAVALTGSVTYVNVPAGKDIYGVFYVHPNTIGRYSSDRGSDDFERKFDVHLEAYVGGQLMDKIDKNKETDPDWFKPLVPIPGLVYRQDQCPFIVNDTSKYPGVKLPAAAAQ